MIAECCKDMLESELIQDYLLYHEDWRVKTDGFRITGVEISDIHNCISVHVEYYGEWKETITLNLLNLMAFVYSKVK